MPKRGNWGDWAIIDLPPSPIKKVSCFACIHYINEDGSCAKTAHIPKIDGKDKWKKCRYFQLSPEYMDYSFKQEVIKTRGNSYYKPISDENVQEKDVAQDIIVNGELSDVREKVICKREKGCTHKIQFNSKSAKGFRQRLAKYYNARKYDEDVIRKELREKGCSEQLVKEGIQWYADLSANRIRETLEIVPQGLVDAFVSNEPGEFSIALAMFFYVNGIETATNLNCQMYCEAIRAFALDYILGSHKHLGTLATDNKVKTKMIFLDALSIILINANIIHPLKYQFSAEQFINKNL